MIGVDIEEGEGEAGRCWGLGNIFREITGIRMMKIKWALHVKFRERGTKMAVDRIDLINFLTWVLNN